jgi:F-type H+-transporting ATPase subunit epsilon
MAATLQFELVSPEKKLASAQVAMVVVPGTEGDFGVLPGHAPMMSTIRPGVIEIYTSEGTTPSARYQIEGGFAEVAPEGLTILAEEAVLI